MSATVERDTLESAAAAVRTAVNLADGDSLVFDHNGRPCDWRIVTAAWAQAARPKADAFDALPGWAQALARRLERRRRERRRRRHCGR